MSCPPTPASSSTETLATQLTDAVAERKVTSEVVRVVDHPIRCEAMGATDYQDLPSTPEKTAQTTSTAAANAAHLAASCGTTTTRSPADPEPAHPASIRRSTRRILPR